MNPKKPAPNAKFRPLNIVITEKMMAAGLNGLAQIVNGDAEHTDRDLVAAIFYEMWGAFWTEVDETRRKKLAGSPLVHPPSGLILPQ